MIKQEVNIVNTVNDISIKNNEKDIDNKIKSNIDNKTIAQNPFTKNDNLDNNYMNNKKENEINKKDELNIKISDKDISIKSPLSEESKAI